MTRLFLPLMLKSEDKQIVLLTYIGANLIQPDFSLTSAILGVSPSLKPSMQNMALEASWSSLYLRAHSERVRNVHAVRNA